MSKNVKSLTAKNSAYSLAVNIWNMFSRFLLTPVTLYYISIEEFGLWSLCFVVMSFLSMTTTGFEVAYVKYTAEFHAQQRIDALNRVLSTGILLSALLMALLLGGLWFSMDVVIAMLNVEENLRALARWLFFGTALVFTLDITVNSFSRVVEGLQRFDLTAKVKFSTSFLEIILIVIFFIAGLGVYSLLAAFMFRYLVSILIFTRIAYRLLPGLKISLWYVNRESLKQLLNYGGKLQIISLIGIFLSTFDRIIISRILGLAATGLYEIGRKLPVTGTQIPSVISSVMMPAFSHLRGHQDEQQARALFLTASRYMGLTTALVYSGLIVFAPYLIHLWLGPGYAAAVPVLYTVSIGIFSHLLTGPVSAATRGLNQLAIEMRNSVICLILTLILTPLLAHHYGLLGATTGFSIARVIASAYFISAGNRLFKVSGGEYLRGIVAPMMPFLVTMLAFTLLLPHLIDLATISRSLLALNLFLWGLAYLVVCTTVLLFSRTLSNDEKEHIQAIVRRIRRTEPAKVSEKHSA